MGEAGAWRKSYMEGPVVKSQQDVNLAKMLSFGGGVAVLSGKKV